MSRFLVWSALASVAPLVAACAGPYHGYAEGYRGSDYYGAPAPYGYERPYPRPRPRYDSSEYGYRDDRGDRGYQANPRPHDDDQDYAPNQYGYPPPQY
jgi:hypothetical protein